MWEKEPEVLTQACAHKFRTATDVNHFIFSYWQFASGTFMPRDLSIGRLMAQCNDETRNARIYNAIRAQRVKLLCVNDQFSGDNYDEVNAHLTESFQAILPERSAFELA